MNLSGNTILITGGGTGIGRGLAEAFHAAGNSVIITGRRAAPLKATCDANPGMAFATLDVADADAIKAFGTEITAAHPALNVVIHNAGIMTAEDLTATAYDLDAPEAIIAINLLGPMRLTAALLPHLRQQAAATIMTVSSGLAFVPLVATPTYCATKAAIHSWSQSLRAQLKDTSVGVIELAPPAVATDLMPGHAENPNSMPLDAYIAESIAILKADPTTEEICVKNVQFLRGAEERGEYAKVFEILNSRH